MNIIIRKNSGAIDQNSNYSVESHRHINCIRNINYGCKLTRINRIYRLEILIVLVIFNLFESILCNPVFVDNPSIAQFQSGRNIRHLPCIVRKSGLSGTCMFAIDCIKQNGTHLGTCIDRFYFGSCCQMKEDIPFYAQDINDNSIDQNTISHFAHESSTVIPQTSALFQLTTESFLISSSSESLMKNNSTQNKLTSQMPNVSISSNNTMQNRETSTKPQKIAIDLITTYKPVTKHNITGNLTSILVSTTPSTFTSSGDLLSSTLFNNDSISESVSLAAIVSEALSIPNISSQLLQSDTLSFESLSSQSVPSHSTLGQSSTSSLLPSSSLSLQTTTPSNTDLLKPIQTSTNPVLTTTKPTEKPFKITTGESKFSTFQVVETTTPTIPSKTQIISSSSSSKQTTSKPSSKQPITIINVTNKPIPSRRPTTQRTKITRRPTTSTKPTVSSTAFSASTRKPTPQKTATTVRTKPQQITSTRRTTTTPKRPPTKRPTTISTLRPKPVTKRPTSMPTTTIVTSLPKIDATIVKNTTASTETPIKNVTIPQLPTGTTTTRTKATTTSLPLIQAATKAPRPKPKPTGNIVKVPPTNAIFDKVTESISTLAPPSIATNKPFLITGKPLTTKPISTTHHQQTIKNTSATLQTETSTIHTTTLRPILNNTSSITTASTIIIESTTLKPAGLVTWTEVYSPLSINNTNKQDDWIPRPPPDWVLLPTIKPDSEINKTVESTILAPNLNVNKTEEFSNNSELLQTTTSSIIPFTTFKPETSSTKYTQLVNQSSTEGLGGLSTANSISSLNESTTPTTMVDMNTDDSSTISTTMSTSIPSLEGLDYKQICGKRMFPEPRIVGGANAAFGRWPWQISLRQWRTSTYLHKCGAALLNENWAITAAHCVDNVPPSDLLLRLGEYDLAEEEEPYSYQERRVQIVASHPQFDPRTFEYDLALLRFYEPIAFQPNIIPVCVPDNDYDFLEQTAYVTGWGRLYEDGPLPSVLQEVSVPVINNTICETMYRAAGYIEHIPHIFICAGWKKGGYDSCEGDSGGPMVLQRDDKRFVLGGVISWGIGCAEPNQPGVYTRISEFRDWINQILQF